MLHIPKKNARAASLQRSRIGEGKMPITIVATTVMAIARSIEFGTLIGSFGPDSTYMYLITRT